MVNPIYFNCILDAVLSEFIDKTKNIYKIDNAVNSTIKGKTLNLGTPRDYAHFIIKKMLPFLASETKQLIKY
jgi:hypothetical protein